MKENEVVVMNWQGGDNLVVKLAQAGLDPQSIFIKSIGNGFYSLTFQEWPNPETTTPKQWVRKAHIWPIEHLTDAAIQWSNDQSEGQDQYLNECLLDTFKLNTVHFS